MKYISKLTTLFILIAITSNAGMVTDNLTIPPTNTINSSSIKQSPQDILTEIKTDATVIATSENNTTPKSTSKKYAFFTAVGQGDGSVKSVAIGLDIYSKIKWFEGGNWYLTPYTELFVAYWKGDAGHTGNESLYEGGLSLYGRYIRKQTQSFRSSPYIDVGIGLHYVTEDEIEGKELGRQWLAGSNIGIGVVIGKSEKVDIGIRVRHLSNGGTKDVNWGINHIMARLAIRF